MAARRDAIGLPEPGTTLPQREQDRHPPVLSAGSYAEKIPLL